MNKKFHLIALVVVSLVLITSAILYFNHILNFSQFISIILALTLTTLNFMGGLLSVELSFRKDEKAFVRIVFGSMVLRLFLLLIVILIAILFLDINLNSFIFSIFIFYIIYLIIEVFYLNFRKN